MAKPEKVEAKVVPATVALVASVADACDAQSGGLHEPQIAGIVERECQNARARLVEAFRSDVRATMRSKPVTFEANA